MNRPNLEATYSRLAPIYSAWTWFVERRSLVAAVQRAEIREGEAVLEVAVGTGFAFSEVLRRNAAGRNVGVDLTEGMLRRARRRAERTGVPHTLQMADARKLPFADDEFDVVFSSNMLGLLPDADILQALMQMRRVLRPGGRLVLATMFCPKGTVAGWLYDLGALRLGAWRDVELGPLILAAGFDCLGRDVIEQLGVPTEVLWARKRSQ